MIEDKVGDITTVTEGIIVHGCNARGVMGAGVALAIRKKFPDVFSSYALYCARYSPMHSIGTVHYVDVGDTLTVANAITQTHMGGDGGKYVSYDAVDSCMLSLSLRHDPSRKIYMPMIGAGLGGGNWGVILEIVKHRLRDRDVTIMTLP